tara:strand:- start:417 stop:1133 length:717 start_codon:yes stop_codon:yes gene_type:complete
MLKYFLTPIFFIIFVLALLYLLLNPLQIDTENTHNSLIQEMEAITQKNHSRRMQIIRNSFSIIQKIVTGIQTDKIGCIIPSRRDMQNLRKHKIIIPESSAFGGDAVIESQNVIQQENPLLKIAKQNEKIIHKNMNAIQLDLDTNGDKFKTRFMKKTFALKDEIDNLKKQIVSSCSRQKERLKHSHPHLSNYKFIQENTNSDFLPPSTYIHGTSHTPVSRFYPLKDSNIPGLLDEAYSI